jgi:fibronectin type 3 domain-containing protein
VKDPKPGKKITVDLPAAPWVGQEVTAAIRFRGSHGRLSAWSNAVTFTPLAPLPPPVVRAAADPEGIRVTWQSVPGAQYRVSRQAQGDAQPVELATVDRAEFVDRNVTNGQSYTYIVQARSGIAESVRSLPATVVASDTFAPAAPGSLTAVAGVSSAELTWDRNNETDLGSYRVYRKQGDGPFDVVADAVEGVSYTDRQVQAGTLYTYQITALDRSGNESRPSSAVSVMLP